MSHPKKKGQPQGEKKEEESKPYLVFRFCKNQCCACKECGYFWGPDSNWDGQRATWTVERRVAPQEGVEPSTSPTVSDTVGALPAELPGPPETPHT